MINVIKHPKEQIQIFLDWFYHQAVIFFDIHVRRRSAYNESIWLCHNERVSAKYIVTKLLPWIRYENAKGADIYFRPHGADAHRILFLDDVPLEKALKVSKKYTACVVETSSLNTQIWLSTDRPLSKPARKNAQQELRDLGYSDPGSISGDHLGRLCGVKSMKHGTWVNLISATRVKTYVPKALCKEFSFPPVQPNGDLNGEKASCYSVKGAFASKDELQGNFDGSPSGNEWGWVMGMLRTGMDKTVVTERLMEAASSRGKGNAMKYACRTVQKACFELRQI